MMIPSNYEVNVSLLGVHYCKIELSETFPELATKKFKELEEIFKAKYEEFELTLTHVVCYGKDVTIE